MSPDPIKTASRFTFFFFIIFTFHLLVGCSSSSDPANVFSGSALVANLGDGSTTTLLPPVAQNDEYDWLGNTNLTVSSEEGLLANDQSADQISESPSVSAEGGTVLVNADGSFQYQPAFGFLGEDSFQYTVANAFGSDNATVTLQVSHLGWFVDNTALGGIGTLEDPFHSLVTAADASNPGDYIFLLPGDGTTAGQNQGITLKNDQKLLGQGIELSFEGRLILPAAEAPRLTNPSGDGITLADNNEVSGLIIQYTSQDGISGSEIANFNIHDNTVEYSYAPGEGIFITDASGLGIISENLIQDSTNRGIRINKYTGGDLELVVSSNTVLRNGNGGFRITAGAEGVILDAQINDNTFSDNGEMGAGITAVSAIAGANSQLDFHFESNFMQDNIGQGFFFNVYDTNDNSQVNLEFRSNTVSGNTEQGLRLNNQLGSGAIQEFYANTIEDNGMEGVQIYCDNSQPRYLFESNTISGNTDQGIRVGVNEDSSFMIFEFELNTVSENGARGIVLKADGGSELIAGIRGNIFSLNAGTHGFVSHTKGNSQQCLQLVDNVSDGEHGYLLKNGSSSATFNVEETLDSNEGVIDQSEDFPITMVPEGTCVFE